MLAILKRRLNITWDDSDTNSRLQDSIDEGIQALNDVLGDRYIDYKEPSQERTLLLNYCMYCYNNCLDEFWQAYQQQIITLRIKHQIMNEEEEDNG